MGVRLDLMVINRKKLRGDIEIGGSPGFSDHTLAEFEVLRNMGQLKCKVRPLNFRKANFHF